MKLYLLCDMEGVSGLCRTEFCWETKEQANLYQEGRRLITADINAAARAALEAGADELIICDTHGGGGNVLWDELLVDPRITYETPLGAAGLTPGLDETCDGLILLGHHAKAGTLGAFADHTWSGNWFDFQINGLSVGEIGLETCFAGHWDVPLIMVQGDDAACAEAASQFPGIVTAAVKQGLRRTRARGPAPELARQLTAQTVAEAVTLARQKTLQPWKPHLPLTVRWTATDSGVCETYAYRPGVRRLDARTIEYTCDRQCDLLRWL